MLLAYETPVVVLTEVVSFTTFPLDVNATTVRARLWENPNEFLWDLNLLNWNQTDGDGNGLKDDAYGWNRISDSATVAIPDRPRQPAPPALDASPSGLPIFLA